MGVSMLDYAPRKISHRRDANEQIVKNEQESRFVLAVSKLLVCNKMPDLFTIEHTCGGTKKKRKRDM
jgi:hypothetical protein